jgi:hypothetical protein
LFFLCLSEKYAGITMAARENTTEIILDESLIHSGDFFGIMRLDGMDPMLAWAMGSSTGHTTVALWIDGALHVCESTTKAPHWPGLLNTHTHACLCCCR